MSMFYLFQTDEQEKMFRPFEENSIEFLNDGVSTGSGGYRCVESGPFMTKEGNIMDGLEKLFATFNTVHPTAPKSRSMSVSDIVLIEDDKNLVEPFKAYYVDSLGFEELRREDAEVLAVKAKEGQTSDHELLDRIIDNLLTAENPVTVVKYLLYIGFTEEDAMRYGFSQDDIETAKDILGSDDYEGICPIFP